MTRGQNMLTIDHGSAAQAGEGGDGEALIAIPEIIVLAASVEELAEHEASLDKLDKEAKGTCVWRAMSAEPTPTAPN